MSKDSCLEKDIIEGTTLRSRRKVLACTQLMTSRSIETYYHDHQSVENESVPIQLAQCWFPGLAISNAKIYTYFSNKIYGSTRKLLWFEISKMLIVVLRNTFIVFIIIFGTLSFSILAGHRSSTHILAVTFDIDL